MGLIKLAVYGAIGYLVYQTFFADMPGSRGGGSSAGKKLGDAARSAARGIAESFGGDQGGQSQSPGGTRMTGGGGGRPEQTEEMTGTSASHRVGRGVI